MAQAHSVYVGHNERCVNYVGHNERCVNYVGHNERCVNYAINSINSTCCSHEQGVQ